MTEIEALEFDVLMAFRKFGPMSNAEAARRLGLSADWTYRVVCRLMKRGMLAHPKKQRWSLAAKGARHLSAAPVADLKLYEGARSDI